MAFFGAWMASFQALPSSTTVLDREAFAINQSVAAMVSSGQLDAQTSQLVSTVASGLNVNNWNQNTAIQNLTISSMVSSIPSELASSLGDSPLDIVNHLYGFGQSPSNAITWKFCHIAFGKKLFKLNIRELWFHN